MFEAVSVSVFSLSALFALLYCVLIHVIHVHEVHVIVRLSNAISDDPRKRDLQVSLVRALIRRVEREPIRSAFLFSSDRFGRNQNEKPPSSKSISASVKRSDGEVIEVENPQKLPDPSKIAKIENRSAG